MFIAKKFSLKVIAPQLIYLEVADGIELEADDAKEMIASAINLAEGKSYAVLFDATKSGSISADARNEFAKSKKRIAAAIITNSLANKLLSNFFIQVNKPSSPTRIFSEYTEAVDWLQLQIAENIDN